MAQVNGSGIEKGYGGCVFKTGPFGPSSLSSTDPIIECGWELDLETRDEGQSQLITK
jgi:hypothetical protein